MYQEHQAQISKWARSNPENLARVLQFCIVSARQKFFNVPALMQEAELGQGTPLYGWKGQAYFEVWEKRAEIFWNCEDIETGSGTSEEKANFLLGYLADLYGLNVAKAGFACQLAYGRSGCLDTVHTSRFDLPKRFGANFSQRRTPAAKRKLAASYNALVNRLGGTENLWNGWCEAMVPRYPTAFPDAHSVSALHLKCLGLT